MTACVNLRERFGDVYRVQHEESYAADRGEHARTADPWLMVIPCQHGQIYPHGRDVLAASTNTRGGIARKLAALDCTTVVQDGSDGINATFHVRDFERVAELMKPKRRRRMTEEQQRAAAERLAKYAFKPARQSDSEGLERAQTAPDDICTYPRAGPRQAIIGDVPAGVSHRATEISPSYLVGERARARARLQILPTASPSREWPTRELNGV